MAKRDRPAFTNDDEVDSDAGHNKSVDESAQTWNETSLIEDESLANESSRSPHGGLNKESKRTPNYSKATSLVIVMIVMAGIGYGAYAYLHSKQIVLKQPAAVQSENYLGEVSSAELALHNTPDDCWLELHGNVYDLTDYATRHPGGASVITSLAGTTATAQYSIYHNERLLQTIPSTLIGRLVESDVPVEAEPSVRQISLEEIALHSADEDLWVALHGMVYDLTDYAQVHPGGATFITAVAGTDGSDSFDDFHALNLLPLVEQYKIGVLGDVSTEQAPTNSPITDQNVEPEEKPEDQPRKITLGEIALHDNEDDLWVAMHGMVYDLTEYALLHPGGAIFITGVAGTDASDAYDDFHPLTLLPLVRQHIIGVFLEEETTSAPQVSPTHSPSVADDGENDDLAHATPMPSPTPQPLALVPATIWPTTEQDSACLLRLITKEEIEQHVDDMWVLIYKRVYDLSTFNHPGGISYIRQAAGTDATNLFETKHTIDILYDETKGIQHLMIGKVNSESKLVNICDTTTEHATSSPTPEPAPAPIFPYPDTGSPTDTLDPACLVRLITMSEVEAHQDDRWVVFYDRVYDLSSYTHPGGNSYIRLAAGTDGTDFFETHHVEGLLYNSRRGIQYLWLGRLSSESGYLNIC